MISITPESPEIKDLQPEKIGAYLLNHGWKLSSHPNPNLRVFGGFTDDFGQPIQLVLPASLEFWDSLILITKAINLLAAIEERKAVDVLKSIHQSNEMPDQEGLLLFSRDFGRQSQLNKDKIMLTSK